MQILILAGGKGTRLWPLSREKKAKQLLPLLPNDESLLQATVARAQIMASSENIYIVVSNDFQIAEGRQQITSVPKENWLIEPTGKNTAAAIAFGAGVLASKGLSNETMLVLSADHAIANTKPLQEAIVHAETLLNQEPDRLVLLGIVPTRAETGYGYIEVGDNITDDAREVRNYKEKPDTKTAEQYLDDGKHLWNSGMFMWKVTAILQAIADLSPSHVGIIAAARGKENLQTAYDRADAISIDYAVSEKSKRLAVVPMELDWRDIGHWQELKYFFTEQRSASSPGKHLSINTENSLIFNTTDRLVATVGLENIVIVETEDATLVCHADSAQEVKQLVEKLEKEPRNQKHL